MYAHVAGIPLEETALSFAPVAVLAFGGLIALRNRVGDALRTRRPRPRAQAR